MNSFITTWGEGGGGRRRGRRGERRGGRRGSGDYLADGGLERAELPTSRVRGEMEGVCLHHHQCCGPVGPPVQYQIIGSVLRHTHRHTQIPEGKK